MFKDTIALGYFKLNTAICIIGQLAFILFKIYSVGSFANLSWTSLPLYTPALVFLIGIMFTGIIFIFIDLLSRRN